MPRSFMLLVSLATLLLLLPHAHAGVIFFSFRSSTVPLSTDVVFDAIPSEDLPEGASGHPTAIFANSPIAPNVYERFPALVANKDADDVCLYIGAVGGCSACEHDSLGACSWLSDPTFQLKGVCVSKDSADVITTSARSLRLAWPVPMLEINAGETYAFSFIATGISLAIQASAETSAGPKVAAYLLQTQKDLENKFDGEFPPEGILFYQTFIIENPVSGAAGLCPAPGSGEPELSLKAPPYFASASKSATKTAAAGYCLNKGSDLPSNQQTIHYGDRFSAENALFSISDLPFDRCGATNTRNTARPPTVTGFYGFIEDVPSEYFLPPTWECMQEVKASPREMECLALMKKIDCNKYCDPYGKFVSPTLCPDSFLQLVDMCGALADGEKIYGNCPAVTYFFYSLYETMLDLNDYLIEYIETGVFPEFTDDCFDLVGNAHYEVNKDALLNDMHIVPGETDTTLGQCDTLLPLNLNPECGEINFFLL